MDPIDPPAFRLLSPPLRLTREIRLDHLAALVSADALCRWARANGRPAELIQGVLTASQAAQHATERELVKEGLDRATIGREAFAERVHQYEVAAEEELVSTLAALGVDLDLHAGAGGAGGAGGSGGPEAAGTPAGAGGAGPESDCRAARIAFVRLYEEGRVILEERVVSTCPRCQSVIGPFDREPGELPAECHQIALVVDGGPTVLAVGCTAPELLLGAVAVAVPEDHEAVGAKVSLPLVGRDVPVVAEPGTEAPRPVVPGHDGADLELARRLSLVPILVLDVDGVVRVPGPLEGLSRYAARQALVELLSAEGDLISSAPATEPISRCRLCGTVVVPRLGRHWFLSMPDLEVAAADAVRDQGVSFFPPSARESYLAVAGQGGDWCVSNQLWAGQPVPAARCLDCGQLAVGAGDLDRCGKCMGTLAMDDAVLDTRFVAAIGVLAASGWPDDEQGPRSVAPLTTLVVNSRGVGAWAIQLGAVILRLTGALPFGRLAVHEVSFETVAIADIAARIEAEGAAAVRGELVRGDHTDPVSALAMLAAALSDGAEADPEALMTAIAGG